MSHFASFLQRLSDSYLIVSAVVKADSVAVEESVYCWLSVVYLLNGYIVFLLSTITFKFSL